MGLQFLGTKMTGDKSMATKCPATANIPFVSCQLKTIIGVSNPPLYQNVPIFSFQGLKWQKMSFGGFLKDMKFHVSASFPMDSN